MNITRKRWTAIALIAVLLLTFAGCSEMKINDVPEIREYVDVLLNGLLSDDEDAAYCAVYKDVSPESFSEAFVQMQALLAGAEGYTLTPIGYNIRNHSGETTRQLIYQMETPEGNFVVAAVTVDTCEGLVSFQIAPEEETTLNYTGTLGHMQGARPAQWIVLFLGVLTWAFVIWMVIDCSKRKIRRKALVLVLIILGSIILDLSINDSGIKQTFRVGLYLRLSSLILYGDGSVGLGILIPVGAIVYFFMRKRLSSKAEESDSEQFYGALPMEAVPTQSENLPVQEQDDQESQEQS